MRIALVTDGLSRGGAERQVLLAAAELQQLGDRVTVVAYHEHNGYEEFVKANAIDVKVIGCGKSRIGRINTLGDYFRSEKFDVIHGFKDNASFYARFASLKTPDAVCFGGYRCLVTCSPAYRFWHRLPVATPRGWIVNSTAVKDSVADAIKVPPNQIHVVPNGIRLADWTCDLSRETAKTRLGLDKQTSVISMVAQVRRVKNHSFMLSVISLLCHQGWEGVLLAVGAGPELSELKKQAHQLGIAKNVQWLGERMDLPEIYRASDVAVLSSDSEGLPNTLIEASVMGVPSVSTDQGGVGDVIADGETGYLVPVGDSDMMCKQLLKLFGDEPLRQRMGIAASERAREKFSSESMGRCLRTIYEGVDE